jgi:primosomal protein N' (replication factor Y)
MEKRWYYLVVPLAYTGQATAFTYHSEVELPIGQIVQVPISRRQIVGVVIEAANQPTFKTKPITKQLADSAVPPDLLELANWIADYYGASPSSVWSNILPTGLEIDRRARASRDPGPAHGLPTQPLTRDQSAALTLIRNSSKRSHLLQGVTGSGKTRIYMELAADAINASRSVIILVPEITLTPQIVGQFEEAFGPIVLASHSKLTPANRHRIWTDAMAASRAGTPRIIVGPRSCLFMPVTNLGLIVIDECHESSYKQEQHPRYHALAVAAKRAAISNASLIMGSATPGLGELFLAEQGRIEHIILSQRINEIPHAKGQILDLRDKQLFNLSKYITQPILEAVADTIASGRQSLLYLNRRGSASSQVCGTCGHITNCPNCNLPLTFHADLMRLICHHCNYRISNPAICPECKGMDLKLIGGGTKRIEAEIERLFPTARIARLDRDSATIAHIQSVLRDLKRGELDILIGTQMIAKGLDLPAIDTVGVVGADTMLHLPDYTAAERTYQLLSQVSGRTGRGDRAGQIFIQTYTPEHPAIVAAASGNYDRFAQAELAERKAMRYPPFVYLLKLTVAEKTRDAAQGEALALVRTLRARPGLDIIGPAPAFIETKGGSFHWVLTVKSSRRPPLVDIAKNLPGLHWTADLDPINLL